MKIEEKNDKRMCDAQHDTKEKFSKILKKMKTLFSLKFEKIVWLTFSFVSNEKLNRAEKFNIQWLKIKDETKK